MARIMSPISFSAVKASALELGSETVGLASASLSQRDWTCDSERPAGVRIRSEEHTSELQSQSNLVCRLLLEKKKRHQRQPHSRGSSRPFHNRVSRLPQPLSLRSTNEEDANPLDPAPSRLTADDLHPHHQVLN